MMHELIVIGGGPAGLAAAAYAVRKRMDALFISKGLGGRTQRHLQVPWVEDYQVVVGEETIQRFRAQLDYLGFMRVRALVNKIAPLEGGFRVEVADGKTYDTQALILATGAVGERLNVPGEDEYELKGLCYSAMTYAPLMVDRNVVVIGDELLALRAVAELARIATQVTLIAATDGDLDKPIGEKVLAAENVVVKRKANVLEIKGDGKYARSVVINQEGRVQEIPVDAIFIGKELIPNSDLILDLVETDECGFIRVDARNRTTKLGLFAAGDVTNAMAFQVLMGLGDGEKAALSAFDYLLGLGGEDFVCETNG
ncbi:MAG: NAD(P)/FAD-dependent oxidoreductase [Anaerolineae bacterium]|nr:NAD(P)/FAD-dependent oxidoreductase [Anaerolineae bacterium]